MKRALSFSSLLAGAALLSQLCSCSLLKEEVTDPQATGKILQVTSHPASLGYNRLGYHSAVYPGLAKFLEANGYPDYLVEDKSFTSRQMVVFYRKPNKAYLFQMKDSLSGQKLKVTGPEPIGKKTRALFDAIDHAGRAASGQGAGSAKRSNRKGVP